VSEDGRDALHHVETQIQYIDHLAVSNAVST